jgi:predicted alpha-1,2-mannosidase
MMKKIFCAALLLLCQVGLRADLADNVNPLVGTDNHGHVFVGASVPFGAVNVGPNEMGEGWDWCSGYNYTDNQIKGFSMLHLSGPGCADLGDVCLMPVTGKVSLHRGNASQPETGFFSTFSHQSETVSPGYYSVLLSRYGIRAEMTATERVGLLRFIFPKAENPRVVIDLENGISDRAVSCHLSQLNDTTIVGCRISRGWAARQYVYFAAVFSRPMSRLICSVNDEAVEGTEVDSPHAYGQACFDMEQGGSLQVKVGISAVSESNALLNLRTEMPGWNFEDIASGARRKWNTELGRVQASFNSRKEQVAFYTALYHTMIAPQLFCDVNGDYRGSDGQIHKAAGFRNYTTWSLWDTYRSFHPLATLIYPDLQYDWYQSMLHIWREQGFLPIWHLMGNETYCMVGISSVPVLSDMCIKGFVRKEDQAEAYRAMTSTMNRPFRDVDTFNVYGYVPFSHAAEDVAKSLEYGLDDWSLAQVAAMMGHKDDYATYFRRSQAYRLLYDKATGFIRPKSNTGEFQSVHNFRPNIQTRSYTEGNPWQYLWLVPHDVCGLYTLMGGPDTFAARLDSLFEADSDLGEDYTPDIAGMVGQYAHGNEPSHHIAYLYNYVGRPWKAADRLRHIMSTLYGDGPAGLPGNEDVGQMSAWYVLSAIGLYQVEPCGGRYCIGSPIVNEASLNVGNGKCFRIKVYGNSDRNRYIQKATLNGHRYRKSYLYYKDIVAGGLLELWMGATPSAFGTKKADWPGRFDARKAGVVIAPRQP